MTGDHRAPIAVGPLTIAHRINTARRIRRVLARGGGAETDVRFTRAGIRVAHDADKPGQAFTTCVDAALVAARRRRFPGRPRWLLELKTSPTDPAQEARFRAQLQRLHNTVDVRLVAFDPDVLAPFVADPVVPVYLFVQGRGSPQRTSWSDVRARAPDPRLGLHVRLHRFGGAQPRPSLDEVEATGRPFQMSGWVPWLRGWPRRRLAGVWNVRGVR